VKVIILLLGGLEKIGVNPKEFMGIHPFGKNQVMN
jgi:hypothetical protein